MNMYKMIFSPTGGTEKAASIFADAFQATFKNEIKTVDLTDQNYNFSNLKINTEDICIVAVPSYGGRVPGPAIERIKKIKGNGAKAILLCVYGNRAYEDTLSELQDALEYSGFTCVSAAAAVAEHSIMHQFAAGRPDAKDKKELAEFAAEIYKKVTSLDNSENAQMPKLILPGCHNTYKDYNGVPFKPKANKNCVNCGLCAKTCPAGAIDSDNPRTTNKDLCISCMRCVSVCPTHARDLNKIVLTIASKAMSKSCGGRKSNELFL